MSQIELSTAANPWITVHFLCISGVDNMTAAEKEAVEVSL